MAASPLDAIVSALSVEINAFAICKIHPGVGRIFPPADAIEVHHIREAPSISLCSQRLKA